MCRLHANDELKILISHLKLINEFTYSLTTVTHKVTAGAKAFGSFFSGVVNKAGDFGGKLKDSVKHNVSGFINYPSRAS